MSVGSSGSRIHTTWWRTPPAISAARSATGFIGTTAPLRSEAFAVISDLAACIGDARGHRVGTEPAEDRHPDRPDLRAGHQRRDGLDRHRQERARPCRPRPRRAATGSSRSRRSSRGGRRRMPRGRRHPRLPRRRPRRRRRARPSDRRTGGRRSCAPPTNHVAHSGPRDRSTTCSYGVENSMSRSLTTAFQNHSTSSTERAVSSRSVSMPWACMSRVTFAVSMSPWSGDQMKRSCWESAHGATEPACQLSADQHASDLGGAGADRVELRVPEQATGGHLVEIASAAHGLDRLERDLHGSFGSASRHAAAAAE